jgi:phage terminase large subunit-like protein
MITDHNGIHSWLLEYISKCKSGEIIIGRELVKQLDILLGNFRDPDIQVDFTEAHKRIRFVEEQCKHSEAPFAGKPFTLALFQKAFIEAIYCFKIYDAELERWVRKHQDILFVVGRKNGKTPLVSALCLAEFFCGNLGTKILCSSNDYDQADLMFQAIDAMRDQSPKLSRVTRKNIKGIFFGNPKKPRHTGKFSYKNKGSIRKISARTKGKEGRNIAVGAADEIHELKDDTPIMPIRQALSTQDEPLYYELTTDGFVNDGYLDHRIAEARMVLNRELDRPRWLIWLYTQDNEPEIWQDEKSWLKSNPGLKIIKKWSFLRGMVEEAKTNTATRAFVLAKDFNIKQNSSSAWLMPQEYINEATFGIEELKGCVAIGGVDLAETTDLLSTKALVMKRGDPHKYIIQHYFIPEAKQDLSDDHVDYLKWARKDLITVCPGNENDFDMVTQWFISLLKNYGIRFFKIGYDGWHAKEWAKSMDDMGFETVRQNQDYKTLSNPMKALEADFRSRLVVYNHHPIDEWCISNCSLSMDRLGRIMPVKVQGKAMNRIDGVASTLDCYATLQDFKTDYMKIVNG